MCYLYILAVPINEYSITKKEEESSAKGHIFVDFHPLFFLNLGHLERCIIPPPLTRPMFLQLFVEIKAFKAFYLSKRALRAGTTRHSWLK